MYLHYLFKNNGGLQDSSTPACCLATCLPTLCRLVLLTQVCRYRSKGVLLGKIRPKIKWADVEAVKAELQKQLDGILGGVTEEDLREPEKKKKKKVRGWGS